MRFIPALLLILPAAGAAQSAPAVPVSPRIAALQREIAAGRRSAEAEFWKSVDSSKSPVIEKLPGNDAFVLATFVWHGDASTTRVVLNTRLNAADPTVDPKTRLTRVANSDVWFVTERLPADAELLYQFFVNPPESDQNAVAWARSARPDPLNPLGYPDKSDPMFDAAQPWRNGSIARMPAVPANPWVAKQSGVAAGTLDEHSVQSAALTMGNPRAVWVYRTPGPMPPNPNVLVLCDGGTTYQNRIPTRTILDNLYAAKKIGPTVALFVDNGGPARNVDGNFSDLYVRFLADELLPWAQRQFGFKARAAHTVFGGDSICGLIGAYAALKRSDVFGGVLAQSGAFQFNNSHDASDAREPEWLARYVARSPKAPVTFYMEVGQVENRPEGNDGTSLLAANRHLRDVLRAKGYDVRYTEVFGDHDPVHWTRTLPDALTAMLGPTARQDQPRNFRSGAQ